MNTPLSQQTRAGLRDQTIQQHSWQAAHLVTDTNTSLSTERHSVSLPPLTCN